MIHAIICKKPFVYVSNESAEILKEDFEYIVENADSLLSGLTLPRVFNTFELLNGVDLLKALKKALPSKGTYYTFEGGKLVEKLFNRKAPHFYIDSGVYIRYPTYCEDQDTIRSALFCEANRLPEKISALTTDMLLHTENYDVENLSLSVDSPVKVADVVGYVCIPVIMDKIPIGTN